MKKLKPILKPYMEQFKRSPLWVKITVILCISWLVMPIDPWDILFPWIAFHDDLFIAGILLKLLHKYGGLPNEDPTKPIDLLKDIFKKSEGIKKNHNH